MHTPENALEENRRLRRTMRDLVALSTLPAVWIGLGPDGIIHSLADVLLNALSLDLIYARLEGLTGGGAIEVVRNKHGPDAAGVEAVKAALAPVLGPERPDPPFTIFDPFGAGTLHVALTRFGIAGDSGVLVAASRRADFPSERDRLLLGVGANQTAIVVQRRRAEEQLREQQERLRTTLACIGDAVIATDRAGRITTMNAVAESLTGWAREEATGQPLDAVFRMVNEETRQPVQNPATRAMREGVVVGLANHTVLIAKDGTERTIDDSAAPIRCKEGQIVGCVLVFRDVTERRRLEKRKAEQGKAARRLAAIVDSSEDAIVSKTLDSIIQSWNAAAERIFGYTAEEAVGRHITILFPADRLEEEDRIIARIRAGERVEHFDTVRLRKDGTAIPVSLTISPIKDEEGRIVGASKIARDITERKRAEAAAAEQHRLTSLRADLAAALASASDPATTLQRCAEAIVRHLDASFARIWTLDEAGRMLELRASAGLYTQRNGPHSRVKVGEFTIGRIAATRQPHLTNDVRHDPNVSDPAWAEQEGMAAFAGYPLMIEGRVLGVVALAARSPLTEAVVRDLGPLAEGIAQYLDRKRAEAAVEASEKQFRTLAESIPQLAWMANPDGHIFWYNRRWYDYTGTTFEQMEGWGWRSVHDPDVLPAVVQRWKHSLATGEPFDMVFPLRGKDGAFRPFLTRVEPVKDDEGRVVRWFGTNTDISEAKRAEERLRESRERLTAALTASNTGTFRWDIRTNALEWDDNLDRLFGLPAGRTARSLDQFVQMVHPDDRRGVRQRCERSTTEGVDFEMDFRVVWPDGSSHWLADRGKTHRDGDGRPLYMTGACVDITRRKQAEERLRLLSEAAAVILDAPDPDALMRTLFAKIGPTLGADICLNYLVNDAGDGLRLASCVGVPEGAVLPRLGFGETLCGLAALHRQSVVAAHVQQSDEPEARAYRSLGVRAYAGLPLVSGNLLLGTLSFASRSKDEFAPDERGFLETICHYVAVACERLRLVEKLRQADRKKDEFLATLAHELRNPLAPIRTGLQLIQLAGGKAGTVEQARTMMERQVAQLVRLVDDLMDLTRISRGKVELKKAPVELAKVIQSAVETSRPLIDEMGHELTVSLPDRRIMVDADLTRLAQVFWNLLTNAAKYTDRGGRIWLTAERQGSDVVVAVRDTGIGIPAEKLPGIFEMFSQVEGALSRSQGGLGIGLCLVKQLVQMHGGSVEAESEGPGRGSRFVVRLPVAVAQEDANTTSDNGEAVTASKLRILVVDDNWDAAESLAMLLKLMGNNVRTARDGEKGVQAAGEFRPHVVLLDIGLPKLNGYEACRLIRQRAWSKNMVLIAVTGWGAEEDRRKSQEAGFDYHMVKPVDPTSLMKLLAGLLLTPA